MVTFRDVTSERVRDRHRSSLLAYLAHELKNALGLMGGQAGLLAKGREGEFDLTREEILGHVTRETARLLRLISDVSRLNRTQADLFRLILEPVDLAEVVTESLSGLQARMRRKRIALALELPPALPQVMGSKDHLIQVCENLLTNALKVTPEGGQITLSAREEGNMARVSVHVARTFGVQEVRFRRRGRRLRCRGEERGTANISTIPPMKQRTATSATTRSGTTCLIGASAANPSLRPPHFGDPRLAVRPEVLRLAPQQTEPCRGEV